MSADYEYSYDEDYGGRVLWGRIAFFGVALVIAFFLGTCLGGGDADLAAELQEQQRQVVTLSSENAELRQQLGETEVEAAENEPAPTAESPQTTGTSTPDATATAEETETVQTYVVKANDTLFGIAQAMYGDGTLWPRIAEANNIDSQNHLREGQELTIPPKP